MSLITPDIGLIFWMLVAVSIVFLLLKKFAWTPILTIIKEREQSISDALNSADDAKKEMEIMTTKNRELIKEAHAESKKILDKAKKTKENIVAYAKEKAQEESDKIIENTKREIENERKSAIENIKNEIAILSINIAEKILKEDLSKKDRQKKLVNDLLEEITLN